MGKVKWLFLAILSFLVVPFALWAADIQMHGDLNNRFTIYNNHIDLFSQHQLDDGNVNDWWGEAKYRMWWDMSTNDGKVKGIWAVEIGGLEYGKGGSVGKSVGGGFSGDGVNIETRWLYTDFKLPWYDKMGVKMGLFGLKLNKYFWVETQMGVQFYGSVNNVKYMFGWTRGDRYRKTNKDDDTSDLDSYYLKLDFNPCCNTKLSLFFDYIYKNRDSSAGYANITAKRGEWYEIKRIKDADLSIFTAGLSGSYKYDKFFTNFDFIYEGGNIDKVNFTGYDGLGRSGDFDLNAYFAHIDLGLNFGAAKLTYRFWYASGDDDSNDSDFDAFMSVDVDITDSMALMEGPYTDDDYFMETPYIGDKGFIMNELMLDYKATKKLTVGCRAMYMMTAEDIEYYDNAGKKQSDDKLGFEINAYLKYKLYSNVEFAWNAGFFVSDDAMDYWEVDRDGNADENVFLTTARVRYKF